jgi:hypothetical protein
MKASGARVRTPEETAKRLRDIEQRLKSDKPPMSDETRKALEQTRQELRGK